MRNIYICDAQANIINGTEYCGLSEQVWTVTFKCIVEQHKFQILGALWQYYWGREGNAFLSPNEIELLISDIQNLKPLLNNLEALETEIQACYVFFDCLLELSQKAKNANYSLKFVAD